MAVNLISSNMSDADTNLLSLRIRLPTLCPLVVLTSILLLTYVRPIKTDPARRETGQPTSSGRPTLPTAQSGGGKGR